MAIDRLLMWGLLGAAIAVRCGVIALDPSAFQLDIDQYRSLGENLVSHGVYGAGDIPSAFRPPLYPLALAGAEECALPDL